MKLGKEQGEKHKQATLFKLRTTSCLTLFINEIKKLLTGKYNFTHVENFRWTVWTKTATHLFRRLKKNLSVFCRPGCSFSSCFRLFVSKLSWAPWTLLLDLCLCNSTSWLSKWGSWSALCQHPPNILKHNAKHFRPASSPMAPCTKDRMEMAAANVLICNVNHL